MRTFNSMRSNFLCLIHLSRYSSNIVSKSWRIACIAVSFPPSTLIVALATFSSIEFSRNHPCRTPCRTPCHTLFRKCSMTFVFHISVAFVALRLLWCSWYIFADSCLPSFFSCQSFNIIVHLQRLQSIVYVFK